MLDQLDAIARRGGTLALSHFRETSLHVEAKGRLDLVTDADRAVERQLTADLTAAFPEDGIIGEEGASIRPHAARQWIIDPIDGTLNYIRGMTDWAVSIGLLEHGKPRMGAVYAPIRDEMLLGGSIEGGWLNGVSLPALTPFDPTCGIISVSSATTTQPDLEACLIRHILADHQFSYRSIGSTAVSLIQLAQGQVDAALGMGAKAWDVMGGMAVVAGLAGACSIDFSGHKVGAPIDYVCGKPDVVNALSGLLA